MRKDLRDIRNELVGICDAEANKLWRLARRLLAHGGSLETASAIREEADSLWMTAYPERAIQRAYDGTYRYAFKL